MTPAEYTKFVGDFAATWAAVSKSAGIQLELGEDLRWGVLPESQVLLRRERATPVALILSIAHPMSATGVARSRR